MLGFDEQVGSEAHRVGRVIGNDHALGGAEQHHGGHPVPLHFHLGAGDGRRAGAHNLAYLGERVGAEAECRDTRRPVHAEHLGDTELAAHGEHRWVHLTGTAGYRRHHQSDVGHTGHHCGHAELVGDAGVAGFAAGHEQPSRRDGGDLLAHHQARFALETPVRRAVHQPLVEGPQVGDGVVDGRIDLGRHPGSLEFVGTHPQLVGLERDVVEVAQGAADGFIAVGLHIVDDAPDGGAQARVEDVVEPAMQQCCPRRLVHRCPRHTAHHARITRHARDGIGAVCQRNGLGH